MTTKKQSRNNKQFQTRKTTNKTWVDFGIRGTPEENKLIVEAATITRQSRCQFVLQASLERAATYLQTKVK